MDRSRLYQPTILDYTKIVSVVYAIVLSSLGIIFPIAEALKNQWLKTFYNTVFLTFNLTLSSLFLVYLLFYNLRFSKNVKNTSNKREGLKISQYLPNILKSFEKGNVCRDLGRGRETVAFDDNMDMCNDLASQCNGDIFDEQPTVQNQRNHSVSLNSCGGIDLGLLGNNLKPHDPDTESCPEKPLYYSREIIPIDDFQKPKRFRRSSAYATIREVNSRNNSSSDTEKNKPMETNNNDNVTAAKPSNPLTWVDVESFGSVFTHHGSSMFLRLGALIFGLGNLVNYALEIQANLFSNVECLNKLRFGWIFIWKFIFVFLQTFFLFKHAMIHVKKHRPLVWFGMVHLIFTNINLWIHTLVREIKDEYHYKILLASYRTNTIKFSKALNEVCDSDLLHSVAKYLMPFVLEYSLIAVGSISCFLYFGGIESESVITKDNRHLIRVFSLAPSDFQKINHVSENLPEKLQQAETKVRFCHTVNIEMKKNPNRRKSEASSIGQHRSGSRHNPLQKSHVGLFCGIVVLGLAVVTCVVFLFSQLQDNRFRAEIIFHSTDIAIHTLLLIACFMVFFLTKNLAFVPKPTTTDDFLLLLAAFGSLTYEAVNASALFSMLLAPSDDYKVKMMSSYQPNSTMFHNATYIRKNVTENGQNLDHEHTYLLRDHLQLASSMLGMIQTAVQTLLILVSLRRYPVSLKDAKEMPGRGTLAFLILGNISVWILRTVLTKNLQLPVQDTFYGMVSWHLLMNINLPLLLFFRFHSSACFADIWKVAYQLLTRPEKQLVDVHCN